MIPFLSLKDVTNKYKDEIHEAALRVIDSGWYLQGKENEKFEADYARYIGTKHCVGVANGLDVSRPEALRIKRADSFSEKNLSLSLSYLKKKKQHTYMAGEGLIEKGLWGDTVLNPCILLESGGSYWKIKDLLAGESFAFKAKIEGVFDEFKILLCKENDSVYEVLAQKAFGVKTIKNWKTSLVLWAREHVPFFAFVILDKIRRR